MNLSISAHFKKQLIMELDINDINLSNSNNNLDFKEINENNINDFKNDDFIPLSMMKNHKYIGVYMDNSPVGFASVVYKGQRGDYFKVKNCDLYLQKLYVFPKYRGRRVMQDIMLHCISLKTPDGKLPKKVTLCVRPDNKSAIKCYERFGFKSLKYVHFIRFYRDYIFPVHHV